MDNPTSNAPAQLSLAHEILHDLFAVGIVAASIFVKNPQSQQRAAVIIDALKGLVPSL